MLKIKKKLITKTTLAKSPRLSSVRIFNIAHLTSVWHFCGARNAEKLENLDKRIVRFILSNFESTFNIVLSEVNCVSLYNRDTSTYTIC